MFRTSSTQCGGERSAASHCCRCTAYRGAESCLVLGVPGIHRGARHDRSDRCHAGARFVHPSCLRPHHSLRFSCSHPIVTLHLPSHGYLPNLMLHLLDDTRQAIPPDYSARPYGGSGRYSREEESSGRHPTREELWEEQPPPPPPPPVDVQVVWLSVLIVPVSVLTLLLLVFLGFHVYLYTTGETKVHVCEAPRVSSCMGRARHSKQVHALWRCWQACRQRRCCGSGGRAGH